MNKKRKGFTLIELLVVIAIIGLLSTLAIVSLNTARQKSRNTKRQADIRTLQSAVELFINEYGNPPVVPATWGALTAAAPVGLGSFLASSTPPSPPRAPNCDPDTPFADDTQDCYMYCVQGTNYLLAARNENVPDGIEGDLDTNIDYAATECVVSGGASTFNPAVDTCDDPVFCLGK
jgi:prepilin-type N-terminal cleavage/methylation domain-containing protein